VSADTNKPAWPNGPPLVGARAERAREVSAADIVKFTEISGDNNPLSKSSMRGFTRSSNFAKVRSSFA